MSGNDKAQLIETVVDYAMVSIGHCYAWGGAPGTGGQQCWDCSSFANFTWGVVAAQAIPGYAQGQYTGADHGPSTVTWLAAQGGVVGSIPRALAQAGDLAVWPTHMGICISNSEMISAQDPANGTQQSGIDGFIAGEQLIILRMAVIGPGGITLPNFGISDEGAIDQVIRQIAQSSRTLVGVRERIRNANRIAGHG